MITPRVWVAAGLVVIAACAIPEAPPGGALDTRPPEVSSTYPPEGAAGIPVDTEVQIGFDENMRKARLERLLTFNPPVVIKKASWKANVLNVVLDEPLQTDTTYVVQLRSGFSDAHGVKSTKGFRFAFATSTAIDSGMISGRILFRRKPSDKGVVRLFVLPKDSAFAAEAARPDRETVCGDDGVFRFEYLPTRGTSFLLWAFQDKNGNLNFNRDQESAAVGDTVFLSPQVPRAQGGDIYITDPKEPASVAGSVDNRTGVDSLPAVVTMHELEDSVPPSYYVRCKPDGSFQLDVLQGTYVVWGFLDFRSDSLCGTYPCGEDSTGTCLEPCVMYPDTLRIQPGDKVQLGELVLDERGGG